MRISIIGSGSGAFAAAIYAAEQGASVTLIERGLTGGTCVNVGCVPSKIFIRAAQMAHYQQAHPFQGVSTQAPAIQRALLASQQQQRVEALRYAKYESIVESNPNITLVQGTARFRDKNTLIVSSGGAEEQVIEADRILIATGSSAYIPPIPGLSDTPYWTSTEALQSESLPEHLIVVGSSVVAVELAQAFLRLGSQVTLLARSTLFSKDDPEIGAQLQAVFEAEGMRVLTQTTPQAFHYAENQFHVTLGEETLVGDRVLIATGRHANVEALDLDSAGVALDSQRRIVVDERLRTNVDTIFAAGDCTDQPQFVYVAAKAGTYAAVNMLGHQAPLDLSLVPSVTFTDPQVATVGLTEAEALAQGIAVESRTLTPDNIARALANFDTRGFIKLVAEQGTGRLLGAQILAAEGGEVIQTIVVAIHNQMTVKALSGLLFPYLTMVEGVKLCAQTFNMDVKALSCCAGVAPDVDEIAKRDTSSDSPLTVLLDRIRALLPLKARQQELDERGVRVHQAILRSFAERGRPPVQEELTPLLVGGALAPVLTALKQRDLVVMNNAEEITGAYPFTRESTPHTLMINGHTLYAMCAFDAVGVSAMFGAEAEIHSQCHLTHTPIQITIHNKAVVAVSHPDLRIGLYSQSPGACAAQHLCPELVFLRDPSTADDWVLQKEKKENAVLLTLEEGIEVSSAYFLPLMSEETTTAPSNVSRLGIFGAQQREEQSPSGDVLAPEDKKHDCCRASL